MLNKKAIAAFAAGATLLSDLAFVAPAFVDGDAAPQGAAAPLAKTGAAVDLAAVAASVLAGMGVALREIRH